MSSDSRDGRGHDYDRQDFAAALSSVGLREGDVVFSHSNVGFFGVPAGGREPDVLFETIAGAFGDVLGEAGTLVVPTFTYSFPRREQFDPAETPSTVGMFTELVRRRPHARRSVDPIFSVAAIGARAGELTRDVPRECFGEGSFWERFLEADGKICNLNFDAGSTFIHYVERCLDVPYRYDKVFTGEIVRQGTTKQEAAIHFCRDLTNDLTHPVFEPFDSTARDRGLVETASVGRGAVVEIDAADVFGLIEQELRDRPWFLVEACRVDREPSLIGESEVTCDVDLEEDASPDEIVRELAPLPRHLISDGYDAALEALTRQLSMEVHEYPTGTHAWTWIVPEKWTCRSASLQTMDGEVVFSSREDPLHVASYSLPFEGAVDRDELREHVTVDENHPDALPFTFDYYERDWGLACSARQWEELDEERYHVEIDAEFSYGTLKVGSAFARGRSEQEVVLCTHLDHPTIANDGLSGVAVGVDVLRRLREREELHFNYRLLVLPETIGSIAYLSDHEELLERMAGGLFLEALGLENPHALQLSLYGTTEIDRVCRTALAGLDPDGWVGGYRDVIGNDERQFNAPGVRIPMLSLSRVLRPGEENWPYRGYHTSRDRYELVSEKSLEESRDTVLGLIDCIERNCRPENRYRGEVFCSRYGIHLDPEVNPEGHRELFSIMDIVDGSRTVAEIARECGISFQAAYETISQLAGEDLVVMGDPCL